MSAGEGPRMAADRDLVFADWDAVTERVMSMMNAHLPIPNGMLLDATRRPRPGACSRSRRCEGLRTQTRRLHPVSELELREEMEACGFHVRRTGKMLGRVVLSGVAV